MKERLITLSFFMILIVFIFGCTQKTTDTNQTTITVAAASDLRFAFEEIGTLYEEKTATRVVFLFGSSGNLAQQISQGAPIDLFASANKEFIEDLIESEHLIAETKELYAIGRIVLAVNKKSGLEIESLNDLVLKEIDQIAIANPNHAPYGLAAKEALLSSNVWDEIEQKLVYGENVTQTLQFVQTGNAQVGIIAHSIANVPEIEFTIIDDTLHNPLEQMLAVVKNSSHIEISLDFANFINSSEGRAIMEKYEFTLPQNQN
ncbi:MAG: hypothetical protein APF76_11700 [Desulfitibacter sp. BRH_c19]|nr:MAG: hypothetical protein APF76_11700 [Desulfitibacter sp. BRH_c19]